MIKHVILVDQHDNPQGHIEKKEAYERGLLHRGFSVFIFNSKCELLLQKTKYSSKALWANTCIGHAKVGESNFHIAIKKIWAELGMGCDISFLFKFTHNTKFSGGLTEYKVSHVYFGMSETLPAIHPMEKENFKFMDINVLAKDINAHPENYIQGLGLILNRVVRHVSTAMKQKRQLSDVPKYM
ncbi:NUDIX domain-containing protein [Pedobacter sp. HDW13]|uniref:isopentenyl-diphosphate Delta-isomerase n=1 Tax=Pedobacter sp. HDW13 TaxID=2714940 RepID=UPI00140B7439|nr:NUDIX domain-containing protein [Pedobacter sp. HDW13]QIL38349.1 NUDIX domain-containing protein [Pedobacter sp. HDW13]